MDVKAIQARLAAHAVERNWDPFFSPRSLSMAVAGEAGALLAVFQWLSEDQARRIGQTQDRAAVSEAIADVILYALRLAETIDVDIEDAVLARAAQKYPVSARRFEGVDENDARATSSALRGGMPPAASAPVRPAAPPPVPVRPQSVEVVEDEPEEEIRIDSGVEASPPDVPPARPEPSSRARPEPVGRPRSAAPAPAKDEPLRRERSDPPARVRSESPRARAEPPVHVVEAPPARERTPPPEPPLRAERYANLDTNAVLDLIKGLKKRIDDSRSDEAVLHEIKDEIDTLRRNVYSSKSKPAWIAGGLERLSALLQEAASHPIGDKINFKDFIGRISAMLES